MKKFVVLIVLSYLTLFVHAQEASDTIKTYKPVPLPVGYFKQLDVVYTSGEGWSQKMDIYLPMAKVKPTPIVINIHGGGWVSGVKETQGGFGDFFKAGFALANIEYRKTKEATAPAAIEDARCALAYLVKNAKELNLDINKIVVMGGSAGGHLALMTGLLGNDHRFDKNCSGIEPMKVAAIIDKWGINDVWAWAYCCKSKSAQHWLGNKKSDEAYAKSVSPISYISKNSPPIFIIHGNADSTVPYQQSVNLHNKLVELGVKTTFVTVEGGGHGKFEKSKMTELNKQIVDFVLDLDAFKENR